MGTEKIMSFSSEDLGKSSIHKKDNILSEKRVHRELLLLLSFSAATRPLEEQEDHNLFLLDMVVKM